MRAGDPGAKAALASMLYDDATGPTLEQLDELQKAAELGHPGALSQLGRAYLQGEGIPANPVKRRILLERAVEAGNLHAAQTLGSAYLRGDHGLESAPAHARRLLALAVAAGYPHAHLDTRYALIQPRTHRLPPGPRPR